MDKMGGILHWQSQGLPRNFGCKHKPYGIVALQERVKVDLLMLAFFDHGCTYAVFVDIVDQVPFDLETAVGVMSG
jgi:hypothetical protein